MSEIAELRRRVERNEADIAELKRFVEGLKSSYARHLASLLEFLKIEEART